MDQVSPVLWSVEVRDQSQVQTTQLQQQKQ